MTDLAKLGFEINSRPISDASRELARLKRASEGAEAGARGYERGTRSATTATQLLALEAAKAERHIMAIRAAVGGLAAYAGFNTFTNGISSAVERLSSAERVMARVDAIFKTTGNNAGYTTTQIKAFADEMERTTGRVADETMAAAARLASFPTITGDAFTKALQTANDFSELYGGGLEQNLEAIARALEDPVQGMIMLQRQGFKLEESQKAAVKAMMEAGNVAGYQAVIWEMMADSVGVAERSYVGIRKAQDEAKRSTERFFEALVKANSGHSVITGILQKTSSAMEMLTENVGGVQAALTAAAILPFGHALNFVSQKATKTATDMLLVQQMAVTGARASRDGAAAELSMAAARLRNAEAAMVTARANGLVTASYSTLSKELFASKIAHSAASKMHVSEQLAVEAAIKRTTLAARAGSVAMKGLSASMSFVGGPVGAGLLAVGGLLYFASSKAGEAEERSNLYADAIAKAGRESSGASGGILRASEALQAAANSASQAEKAVSKAQAQADMTASMETLKGLFNPFVTGGAFGAIIHDLEKLRKQLEAGKIRAEDFVRATDKLSNLNPSAAGMIAFAQKIAKEFDAAQGKILGFNAAALAAGQVSKLAFKGDRGLTTMDLAEMQYKEALKFALRWGDIQDKLRKGSDKKTGTSKLQREAERATKAYDDLMLSATGRVAQMKLEADSAHLAGIAQDTLALKLDLLQKVEEKRLNLSPKMQQALMDQVDAYEKYANAAARATLTQDLLFERTQMGRSAIEQTIASTLRGAGLEVNFNSVEAGIIRTNEQLKVAKDLSQDFAQGFVSDILNGTSALDALLNGLSRVADKLIQMAMDDLFASAFGGSGSGGLLGSLFGIGGGKGDPWSGLRFASGGYVSGPGSGTSDSILARLSNGEFVVNSASAKLYGPLLEAINDNKLPAFRDGGGVGNYGSAVIPMPSPQSFPNRSDVGGGGGSRGGTYTDQRQYNFKGTSEEFQQFRAYVAEQERNFDARVVDAMREAEQSNYKFGT